MNTTSSPITAEQQPTTDDPCFLCGKPLGDNEDELTMWYYPGGHCPVHIDCARDALEDRATERGIQRSRGGNE